DRQRHPPAAGTVIGGRSTASARYVAPLRTPGGIMLRQFAAIAAASLGLAACSLLPNHSLDYRQAEVLPPMTMPDGMVFLGAQALYVVPDQQDRLTGPRKGEEGFEAPQPPQLLALSAAENGTAGNEAAPPPPG